MSEQGRYLHVPDYLTPPGLSLRSWLRAVKMTQRELAERLELDEATISQIVHGRAPITAKVANALELVTSTKASLWLRMEASYQEQLEKLRSKEALASEWEWLGGFPLAELRKRGWVSRVKDKTEHILDLFRFFGVSGTDAWNALWQEERALAFRRSGAFQSKPKLTATWIRLVQMAADERRVGSFSKSIFKSKLTEIRQLSASHPKGFDEDMKRLCAEAGVVLAFVPEFKGAGINGVSMWYAGKPVIALTLRWKWADIFWFSFFHEAGHVLKHGKGEVFIELKKRAESQQETEADKFATDFLIPPDAANEWLPRIMQSNAKRRLIRLCASELGVCPGIVVGRLQHDELVPFSHHNALRTKLEWCP